MADESLDSLVPPPHTVSDVTPNQSLMSTASGLNASSAYYYPYPPCMPGFVPSQIQEQANNGPGIYAVPVLPNMSPMVGYPFNNLIPLTYNIPTGPSASELRQLGEDQRPVSQEPEQQLPQVAPQRQVVVRRFQIAFQIDLFLILKLAIVIFVFHQDGSRQKFALLVSFAALIYLYQTGALAPLIRWLSHGMERAAVPPRLPRPDGRADNAAAPVRQEMENADMAEGRTGESEAEIQPADGADNENRPEVGVNRWFGIVKEIKMILFGFITSLLPGFHNHLD